MEQKPFFYILIIVIIVLGLSFYYKNQPPSSVEEVVVKHQPLVEKIKETISPKKPNVYKPPAKNFSFVSPMGGEEWEIGKLHTIKWNMEAGAIGQIYLVDAVSKQVVGWINSETGLHQTSYNWDTRSVFVSRYSGLKKDLMVSRYMLKIKFNGVGQEVESKPITIIYPGQEKMIIVPVSLKDYKFSPFVINANKGDKIVFTNNDPVNHRIISAGFGPYVLKSGESVTVNTVNLSSSLYSVYDESYPSMTATVIIK